MNALRVAVGLLLGIASLSSCRDSNRVATRDSPPGLSAITFGHLDPDHRYVGAGAQFAGYSPDALPTSRIHVSFADNVTDPASWREITGYVFHPDFVPPVGASDVALLFLSRPVQRVQPGTLAPAGFLDAFKNTELQAAALFDVGYGTVGAEGGFIVTGDRRIATGISETRRRLPVPGAQSRRPLLR